MQSICTIADTLSPEEIDMMTSAFGTELLEDSQPFGLSFEDWADSHLGVVTGEYLWYSAWLFGIVLDDDAVKVSNLGCYWRPEGTIDTRYYVPDDFDTEVPTLFLDSPEGTDEEGLELDLSVLVED